MTLLENIYIYTAVYEIRQQAVHRESLRSHAHFVLLCSSGMQMQIVVESSGRELKMYVLIPPSRDVNDI